jgi:predicted permease
MTQRRRLEAEMETELQHHLETLAADLIRKGQSPAEATRQARIALGPALVHKDGMRASLGLRWFDELRADLRYAVRMLRKNPGFTAIAAISLALAIGANTTIFSIARQLLYQRLSVPHAEQLRLFRWNGDRRVAVSSMWGDFDTVPDHGMTASVFSYPVYLQLRMHNQVLGDLLAFKEQRMNATIHGNAQNVTAVLASGNYFSVLEVPAQLGRTIQPSDVSGVSQHVVVISDDVWLREFARSPSVIGQSMTVNQVAFTIVGVAPRDFTGAKGVMEKPDVYIPISLQPVVEPKGKTPLLNEPNFWWVNVMGRAKSGMNDRTAEMALNVQLQAAVRATMSIAADSTLPHLELADGSRGLHFADRMFKKPIYVLLALTGLVILLACANIANLLLARGSERQREMSVRLAMGAGRVRILRQLLTESLLLAVVGGAMGLLFGYLGRDILPNLFTNAWEQQEISTPFSWPVFTFTAAVTLVTGILFGMAPALLASRTELSGTLKDTAQHTTRRRKGITGKSVIAFQIALSTLLVVGAGLFARTLIALNSVDVGFNTDHLLLFDINLPGSRYPVGRDIAQHAKLEQRIGVLPGVQNVTVASVPYVADNLDNSTFLPEGEKVEDGKRQQVNRAEDYNIVGNTFFQTLQIPILAGRAFNSQDTATSAKVAVINQSLARKRFPGVNPIGLHFRADRNDGPWIRIVGICADTHYENLRDEPPAQFFVPYIQQPEVRGMVYEVRTSMDVATLAPSLRKVVQSADPDLPVIDLRTQQEQINATMQFERAFAALTAGFGVLALVLACVGIYGIMAYTVAQRTNEIGIRLALGAQPGQVRSMILRESTWLTLGGILAGVGGAVACTRLVQSMLYGVGPNDPATIAAGTMLLLAVALAATWIPARRAAAVQPMDALRHE